MVIDVQKAIDHPSWGRRNHPEAEQNIRQLLDAWRAKGWPVIHVRHRSRESHSTYRSDQPGYEFKELTAPVPGEAVVVKPECCAFIHTDLERLLRDGGIESLAITGLITNNSVEATARVAGNLGFRTFVVEDGTATFDRRALDGSWHTAEDVHAHSLANLQGEYATVVSTAEMLAALNDVVNDVAH